MYEEIEFIAPENEQNRAKSDGSWARPRPHAPVNNLSSGMAAGRIAVADSYLASQLSLRVMEGGEGHCRLLQPQP